MTILDLFRFAVIAAFIGLTVLTIYRHRATIKNRIVLTREQALQKENDRLHREIAETKARALRAEGLVTEENRIHLTPSPPAHQFTDKEEIFGKSIQQMRAEAMLQAQYLNANAQANVWAFSGVTAATNLQAIFTAYGTACPQKSIQRQTIPEAGAWTKPSMAAQFQDLSKFSQIIDPQSQ